MGRSDAKDKPAPQRKSRSIAIVTCVGVILVAAFLTWRFLSPTADPDSSEPSRTRGPTTFEAVVYEVAQPIDSSALRPPPNLPSQRLKEAHGAIALYGQSITALRSRNVSAFAAIARQSLAAFARAGWLPDELSPFHNLYLTACQKNGDLRTTIVEGRRWIEKHPTAVDHLETVGKAEYQAGRFTGAIEMLEKYVIERPKSLRTWRQLAASYQALGAKEKGLAAVAEMLRLIAYPDGNYARHREAAPTIQLALQVTHRFYEYERLAPLARAALKLEPRSHDALMALGVAERQLGNYAEAARLLLRFLEETGGKSSKNAELALLELALAQLKHGDAGAALSSLVDLLTANPNATKAHFQLGRCLVRLGFPLRAEAFFKRSQELAPANREERREIELRGIGNRARAEHAKAESFRLRGLYTQGARVLREALRKSGGSPQIHIYLIEYLYATEQIAAARQEVEAFRARVGQTQSAGRGWSAMVLRAEGRSSEAAQRLTDLLVENPKYVQIWGLRLADLFLEDLQDAVNARKWIQAFLEFGPNAEASILLARTEQLSGNASLALELLSSQNREDHEWAARQGDLVLAGAHLDQSKPVEAGEALARYARQTPSGARPAEFWSLVSRLLEAKAGLQVVRPLLPPGASSAEISAIAALVLEKAADAKSRQQRHLALLRRAATTTGLQSARARIVVASELVQSGDRSGARKQLDAARASAPDAPEVLRALIATLDSPADTFQRFVFERELAKVDPESKAPSRRELVLELRSVLREKQTETTP